MLRTRLATQALRPLSRGVTTSVPRALASHASDSHVARAKSWENPFPSDTFAVGPTNGFLPTKDPLDVLPKEYEAMDTLLENMRLHKKDGTDGLLMTGEFGAAVDRDLPEYDLSKVTDGELLSALYRDLTFVASAYLLEPCDIQYRKDKTYGLGRQTLPRNIAVPLHQVAEKIGQRPFMEYALSYALYNYRRKDKSKPLDFENLDLIRAFSGHPDEYGFILVHVAMVRHSGNLTSASLRALDAAATGNRPGFDQAMKDLLATYQQINGVMETMWGRSRPEGYLAYRTFIMGTKNQPMFPNGVMYEGVSDEPFKMRGESGANDSMVPLGDNLLEITSKMPVNPLTEVLRDFRTYRPRNHQAFLTYVQDRAAAVGIRDFALKNANSAAYYLANVDQIRAFRHRHWNFTRAYILKNTKHPVATGGSPIVTWLPNQLEAVLQHMIETNAEIDHSALSPQLAAMVEEIGQRAEAQQRVLIREVAKLTQERGPGATEVDNVERAAASAGGYGATA
ncbi:hypothetical protein CspeluHIS016_0402800 [Cutaneotrichosporon spelunceum]|uniref:Indoleamine 2,3-dioxygenase n=1 Tax=Cutaneotrichosporon spelunceum TaxID=1672016 RepID=A0AAD3TV18_9TREE|nr:hypothetical protein CspeluHIS016_0402800 [Cutaneotrichosporon spelunceum]